MGTDDHQSFLETWLENSEQVLVKELIESKVKEQSGLELDDMASRLYHSGASEVGIPSDLAAFGVFAEFVLTAAVRWRPRWKSPSPPTLRDVVEVVKFFVENSGDVRLEESDTQSDSTQHDWSTLSYSAVVCIASHASESRKFRKEIGIRKGLFG